MVLSSTVAIFTFTSASPLCYGLWRHFTPEVQSCPTPASSSAPKINPTSAEFATVASSAKGEATIAATNIAHETTKDAGRVHLGGGMMRF